MISERTLSLKTKTERSLTSQPHLANFTIFYQLPFFFRISYLMLKHPPHLYESMVSLLCTGCFKKTQNTDNGLHPQRFLFKWPQVGFKC